MKFLLIGDFHGKIHSKLNRVYNLDFEYALCNGDLVSDGGLRKYIFKYWNELDKKPLEKIIGKEKYNKIRIRSSKTLINTLKFLNSLGKKVYIIRGNFDLEKNSRNKKPSLVSLSKEVKKYKNLELLDARTIKRKDFTLIANSGYRFPTEKGKEKLKFNKYIKKEIARTNSMWDKRLKRIFSQVETFDNSIFLIHDPPLNHLDKILCKESPMYGKNLGDEYYLKYIRKYQPKIVVCGHMHEYSQKTAKIGKSLLVNPGEADKGQFAILSIDKKIEIKFYK